MNEQFKGVLAIFAACTVWGLSPIFYKLLNHVPTIELLAHRTVFGFAIFALLIALQGRVREMFGLFSTWRGAGIIFVAASMITVNWFLFILSVQTNRTLETSLGYFIQPLAAVALGYVLLSERLHFGQKVAVGLAALAVLILTIGLGVAPWVSLALAVTFAFYGFIKKMVLGGPLITVTAEVLLMMPFALAWLWGAHTKGWNFLSDIPGGVFGSDLATSLMLILAGLITAGPLIMLSYGAKRVSMATLGVVQYTNPTLQFICAVFIFGEVFSVVHAVAFAMIWCALGIYTFAALRNPATAVSTSSATVTNPSKL